MLQMIGNWRSAAAFRVRIALNLKGIPCEESFIDLDAGDQHKPGFRAINPQGAVPALYVRLWLTPTLPCLRPCDGSVLISLTPFWADNAASMGTRDSNCARRQATRSSHCVFFLGRGVVMKASSRSVTSISAARSQRGRAPLLVHAPRGAILPASQAGTWANPQSHKLGYRSHPSTDTGSTVIADQAQPSVAAKVLPETLLSRPYRR